MKSEYSNNIRNGVIAMLGCAAAAALITAGASTLAKGSSSSETEPSVETTTYIGTNTSESPYGGNLKVEVDVDSEGTIYAIRILEHNATEGIGTKALDALPDEMIAAQGTDVDYVSGASITSAALINAVDDALSQIPAAK